ncbi:MAG: Smr/MutS family protein [Gammaproteobacteria bacterium]|nr:Smr/MutS family protein [Gammaproteobacteria bacterium]
MKNNHCLKFDADVTPNSYLFNAHSSIGGKLIQKFKRGQIPIQTSLDLHGCTLAQAVDVLEDFLTHCLQSNYRCVLVIHGKDPSTILKKSR